MLPEVIVLILTLLRSTNTLKSPKCTNYNLSLFQGPSLLCIKYFPFSFLCCSQQKSLGVHTAHLSFLLKLYFVFVYNPHSKLLDIFEYQTFISHWFPANLDSMRWNSQETLSTEDTRITLHFVKVNLTISLPFHSSLTTSKIISVLIYRVYFFLVGIWAWHLHKILFNDLKSFSDKVIMTL